MEKPFSKKQSHIFKRFQDNEVGPRHDISIYQTVLRAFSQMIRHHIQWSLMKLRA